MATEVESLKRKYLKKAKRSPRIKLPQCNEKGVQFGNGLESILSSELNNQRTPHSTLESNEEGFVVLQMEGDGSVEGGLGNLSTSPLTGQIMHDIRETVTPHKEQNQSSSVPDTSLRLFPVAEETPLSVCSSCEHTTTQNKTLNNLLSAQRKANKELKNLLVASVGNDLNTKFVKVAEEKAKLSVELEDTLRQLTQDWEEIERLAIESDLWRTKYVASRLMIEELMQWKAALAGQVRENGNLFRRIFEERRQLEAELQKCLVCISHIHSVFSHSLVGFHSAERDIGTQRDVLAVAMAMNHMSKDICSWIGGSQCHHGDNTSSAQLPPTQAEYECQQMVDHQGALLAACNKSPLLDHAHHLHTKPSVTPTSPRLPSLLNTFRAFLSSREDHHNVTFKCRKCKGQIIVV